jgi:hypothetical protein
MIIRNLFIREEAQTLIIGSGLFPEWLRESARLKFGPTATDFGTLTVRIDVARRNCSVELVVDRWNAAPAVHFELPGFEKKTLSQLDQTLRIELEAVSA